MPSGGTFDIGDVPYEPQTVKGWRDGAEVTLLERGVDGAIEEYHRMPAGESEGRKAALGVAIATELYAQGRTADLTESARPCPRTSVTPPRSCEPPP